MQIDDNKIKDLLVVPGHVGELEFAEALSIAKGKYIDIQSVLVDEGLIKDEQLGQLIAEECGYDFINLRKEKINDRILHMIPISISQARKIIAFAQDQDVIKIGMVDPGDLEIRHILEKYFSLKVKLYMITAEDFELAIRKYKSGIEKDFKNMLDKVNQADASAEEKDQMIIKMVDTIMEYGYDSKASDIHIEPYKDKGVIRFRIDGIMHKVLELPRDLLELIDSRIKIMAKMRTDELRGAQDGKFEFDAKNEKIDVRVSSLPTIIGQNLVLRLLSAKNRERGLSSVGLSPDDFVKVKNAIKNPHGMILVTGPTGCGKTTTLYEILKELNTLQVNIATIEDPVEYYIEGISQIQVNNKTNLSFAQGLRAIVRQDPNIIMVGEIRDQETADIAINSAMTGHLVLSTLHANDAATTLPRLLDMGIEPYLVASTINVVIAQRLIRMICEKCRFSYILSEEKQLIDSIPGLKDIIEKKSGKTIDKMTLFKGAGCDACAGTGYNGRIGIFEVIKMEDNIKELVINHAFSKLILETSVKNGMTTMLEDGLDKAFKGMTNLAEIIRVTR